MHVPSDKIIDKMMNEMQAARNEAGNHHKVKEHITKIHLLCELLLDDEEQQSAPKMTVDEQKMMLGKRNETEQMVTENVVIEEGQDSIFDF